MKKIIKIAFWCIIVCVISYYTYYLIGIERNNHSANWQNYKNYLWIFKDSIKDELDTNFCYSYISDSDTYNNFHYKHDYNIVIWEFKNLSFTDLSKIDHIKKIDLENVKFRAGEILNKKGDLEITIKYDYYFNKTLRVNLDNYSRIDKPIIGTNYLGFLGKVNKCSLSNEEGAHQILFNYIEGLTPTALLLYKAHGSLFLIIINSKLPFDEKIINILNLN